MRYVIAIVVMLAPAGCFFPEYTFNDNGCGGGGEGGASGGTGGTGGCGGTGG